MVDGVTVQVGDVTIPAEERRSRWRALQIERYGPAGWRGDRDLRRCGFRINGAASIR